VRLVEWGGGGGGGVGGGGGGVGGGGGGGGGGNIGWRTGAYSCKFSSVACPQITVDVLSICPHTHSKH